MRKIALLKSLIFFVLIVQGRQLDNGKNNSTVFDSLFTANDWRVALDASMVPLFGDNWKKERVLKIGDQLRSDILGEKVLNDSGIARFSQYKGKLVIFDFWATWCGACMVQLAHMEYLQEKFDEQVQIVLVNFWEEKEEIQTKLKIRNKKIELPIILGNKELMASFPVHYIPYHIWIDSLGVIIAKGPSINTYEGRILDYLNGNKITLLQDESTVPAFVPNLPYFKILKRSGYSQEHFFSFFAQYNPNYAPIIGGRVLYYKDTLLEARRTTFINRTIFDLVSYAYKDELKINNLILSPYAGNIYLDTRDTTLITDYFVHQLKQTDKIHIKSRYCYEQIASYLWSEKRMKDSMKADLARYFDSTLNIKFVFTHSMLPIKALVKAKRRSNLLNLMNINFQNNDTFCHKGKYFVRYKDMSVVNAIKSGANWEIIINKFKDYYLIDDLMGQSEKLIVLPLRGTFEELIELLKVQGFEFIERKSNIPKLVIKYK